MSNHHQERGRNLYYILPLLVSGHALSIWLDLSVGKVVLGLMVVGYFPGALLIRLLFRSTRDIDTFERIVLSIVSSLMLCISLGILLNLLPEGLRPSYICLAIWGVIAFLFLLNLWGDRHRVSSGIPIRHHVVHLVRRVVAQSSRQRLVGYFVTGVVAVLCLALLAFLIMSAENDERFTEFYVLSVDGTVNPTLLEFHAGHSGQFFLGISNHTRATQGYYVEAVCLGNQLFHSNTIFVQDGGAEHILTSLQLPDDVAGARLEVRLYMIGETDPLNTLYLQVAE